MKSGIYCIRCIPTGKVYVGSAVNLSRRWWGHQFHLSRGSHHNRKLQSAWRKHGAGAFSFEVLEHVEIERLIEREQFHIDALQAVDRKSGFNLDPTAGSPLGRKFSEESRAKLAEIKRNQSPETRAKLGQASRKRWQDPAFKAMMLAASSTPEAREKAAAKCRGIVHTPESRARMSAGNKGKVHSPEARANMAAAQRGRKASPEARAKISKAALRRAQDPEYKANMSAALRESWRRRKQARRAAQTFLRTGNRPPLFRNPDQETQPRLFE